MPTSYHGQISTILDFIIEEKPKSILDIGVGFGKYGILCRDALDIPFERYKKDDWETIIDGIEGYISYRNPIHDYVYNEVYYGLIEDIIDNIHKHYDIALMIDVLEHFDKEIGEKTINKILKKCKALIISVPAIPAEQNYLDNELEIHKSVWTASDFKIYDIKKVEIIPMTVVNSSIIALLKGCVE